MNTTTRIAPIQIDAIAFQDETGAWIGQCIQYDIAARSEKLIDLPKAIERMVVANICINEKLGRKDLEGIPGAPEKFADSFHSAKIKMLNMPGHETEKQTSPVELHDLRLVEAT